MSGKMFTSFRAFLISVYKKIFLRGRQYAIFKTVAFFLLDN